MRLTLFVTITLLACLCAATPLHAQSALEDSLRHASLVPPGGLGAPVPAHADSAAKPRAVVAPAPVHAESTHAQRALARPWAEFGAGWIASPSDLSHLYQASQGLAAGLEFRPRRGLALRMAADYQMVVAREQGEEQVVVLETGGTVRPDSIAITYEGNAWLLQSRFEAGLALPMDFWVTGGVGGGYMNAGFDPGVGLPSSPIASVTVPRLLANAWGWSWTAALRWDFEPVPEAPLGIDVRQTTFVRNDLTLHAWSIRVCYRLPERRPNGPPQRGGRGRWGD